MLCNVNAPTSRHLHSALQSDTFPLLFFAVLKHDLHTHEQNPTTPQHEQHPLPTPYNPRDQPLQAIDPQRKPHQIRRHHHENIEDGAHTANNTIRVRPILPLSRRKRHPRQHLWEDEQRDEPPPHQQPEIDVMPQRDEGEHREHVGDAANARLLCAAAAALRAAQRYVDVADDPAVVGAVPGAPEGEGAVVVRHAADDVLGRIDAVEQGPEAEETPW